MIPGQAVRRSLWLPAGAVCAALVAVVSSPRAQGSAQDPPRILYTASLRAVEYQLGRLSNAELVRVERRDDDLKYRPVYVALLTRKGLGREYFDEALAALSKMDGTSATGVLLEALARVPAADRETADKMLRFLLAQPVETLRKERERFARAAETGTHPVVLSAAYGGLMMADGGTAVAWDLAQKRGHLEALLHSVPHLGDASTLREALFDPVAALAGQTGDPATRAAALGALGWTRRDAATFRLLAAAIIDGQDPAVRAAAVESLTLVPREAWPADEIEPLTRAMVSLVAKSPVDRRADPDVLAAIELAGKLAAALPDDAGRAIRRDLRGLGVQVVRIETVPEQMAFDLKWFAVEAGKPVQIVLVNPDVMPHNLLISRPGSLEQVGTAAAAMSMPADPRAKPYVPDSPLVLHATRLLNWGESERLNFPAPKEPGEYVFVCTFPGHWVRMYGIMLVVEKLEAWEANPTVPRDPMTGNPFPSPR